jgi:serine/threonine protein kinase
MYQQPTLDAFQLDSTLGEGATGVVYNAVARDDWKESFPEHRYAIKTYKPSLFVHDDAHERLQREASLLSRLQHPNIVRLHGLYASQPKPFSVYEFFDATDITRAKIEDQAILGLAAGLAGALLHIHEAGVLHRDVKPENVLYDGRTAKLCDFGVARSQADATVTRDGQFLGTIRYAPPEYLFEGQYDNASDYWGLGQVLYFAFERQSCIPNYPNFARQVEAVRSFRFARLHATRTMWCKGAFEVILAGLLDPNPKKRFTRGELLVALAALPPSSPEEAEAIADYFAARIWDITNVSVPLDAFARNLPDALVLIDTVACEFSSRIAAVVSSSLLYAEHPLVKEALSWGSKRERARLTATVAACLADDNAAYERVLAHVFEFPLDPNSKDCEANQLSATAALGLVAASRLGGGKDSTRDLLLSYLQRSSSARSDFRWAMIENGDPGDDEAYAFSDALDQVLADLIMVDH